MSQKKALVVIDAQVGLLEGTFEVHAPQAVIDNIALLIERARSLRVPVVFVQHDGDQGGPLEPESDGWAIHPRLMPTAGETVIRKRASDSFYETNLEGLLRDWGIEGIVAAGCMSAMCVDTTCRRATSIGFDVQLASDAHTSARGAALSAAQIVAHHNEVLDDFGNDSHVIRVVPTDAIDFSDG